MFNRFCFEFQLAELHLYLIPTDAWETNRGLADKAVIENCVSIGFVRSGRSDCRMRTLLERGWSGIGSNQCDQMLEYKVAQIFTDIAKEVPTIKN